MRFLTLNCWNVSEPFAERMPLIRAEIAALRPDVLGLQEIVVRGDGFDQGALLLDGLGYERAFGAAYRWTLDGQVLPGDADGDAFGNLIASRWPIRAAERVELPGAESGERRCALAALIDTPAGALVMVCTHLNWKFHHGVIRERQVLALEALTREWAAHSSLPPVIAGDLNAEPDSTEVRFLTGLTSLYGRSTYYQDVWRVRGEGPGYTWDNRNPFAALNFEPERRIDYILVGLADLSGRGRVEHVALAGDRAVDGIFPSDHFGVVADVNM